MKKILLLLAAILMAIPPLTAQPAYVMQMQRKSAAGTLQTKAFSYLDIGVTAGTTGVGFDVATPLNNLFQLRAGFSAMPHFDYDMTFGVQVGDDPSTSASKFMRLQEVLAQYTGFQAEDHVEMVGRPSYWHGKLLVDVTPFRNKHWHLTGGLFVGPSTFATARNAQEYAQSLVSVGLYNNIYDQAKKGYISIEVGNDVYDIYPLLGDRVLSYGRMAIHLGDYSHDILYTEETYYEDDVWENGQLVHQAGDVEHAVGDVKYHKGDPYLMEPDDKSMVRVKMKTNSVKPYLGFGYDGRLVKNSDTYHIGFDAGLLFWGGTPDVITHDGTNLTKDVTGIGGKVGDYVKLIDGVKCFPLLELRLSRRF